MTDKWNKYPEHAARPSDPYWATGGSRWVSPGWETSGPELQWDSDLPQWPPGGAEVKKAKVYGYGNVTTTTGAQQSSTPAQNERKDGKDVTTPAGTALICACGSGKGAAEVSKDVTGPCRIC